MLFPARQTWSALVVDLPQPTSTKLIQIHKSLQDHLDRGHRKQQLFPNAELELAEIRLKYLCFKRFASGCCRTKDELETRLRENWLLEYAAQNWGWHVR